MLSLGILIKQTILKEIKSKIKTTGKPENTLKVFPGLVTYVGRSYEEAYAKTTT